MIKIVLRVLVLWLHSFSLEPMYMQVLTCINSNSSSDFSFILYLHIIICMLQYEFATGHVFAMLHVHGINWTIKLLGFCCCCCYWGCLCSLDMFPEHSWFHRECWGASNGYRLSSTRGDSLRIAFVHVCMVPCKHSLIANMLKRQNTRSLHLKTTLAATTIKKLFENEKLRTFFSICRLWNQPCDKEFSELIGTLPSDMSKISIEDYT